MNAMFFNYRRLLTVSVIITGMVFSAGCNKEEDALPIDRQQFVGNYNVVEDDDGDISNYSIKVIESSKGKDLIEISNFADLMNVNIYAKVKGNKFSIYSQSFESSNKSYTMTLTGEGTVNGGSLSFTYNFFVDEKFDDDWNFGGVCTATKIN